MTELIVRKTKILPGLIDDSLVCGEVLRENSSLTETVCSEGVPYQEKKNGGTCYESLVESSEFYDS